MNNLNIANIHDNAKSQFRVGLDANKFQVKNTGSKFLIEDDANSVTGIKIGGAAGFTITLSGGKISFFSNGGKLLAITEPNKGGVPGCPYFHCHQNKYGSSSAAASSTLSLRSEEISENACTVCTSTISDNSTETTMRDESKLPDPSDLEDGTIMMAVGGHWVEYSFEDLYSLIIDRMNTEYKLDQI